MRTAILLTLGSLLLAAPAFAKRYYYNPSNPNQPGSYNHHVQSNYRTALNTASVATLRDPFSGKIWSGTPNRGAPGAKVIERSYRGLARISGQQLNVAVGQRLGVNPSQVFVQGGKRTIPRPGSIFSSAQKISYRVMGANRKVTASGTFLLVQLKNNLGSRLFKTR